ncbi:hypothetical protein [Streptomyces sp. Je 1-332]|uniref:hypothetical protein n=1 Tax=Streptomyces sp. Je 1-332 TaxID=3231270 RepID=UPI00345A0AF4
MTPTEIPGPEPDWQPATSPPYYSGNNPAHQWSVWEHCSPLFQMIGGLELSVQLVANRLRLHVERSWDGLDDLDVVLFLLRGFSFAVSKHDGNPAGVSLVWLTQSHEDADKALDALLEVLGVGEGIVAFRGDFRDTSSEPSNTAASERTAGDVATSGRTSWWARIRRALGTRTPTD